MIYLAILALLIAAAGFWRRSKIDGLASTVVDTLAASVIGWITGIAIGVGARLGMWSIPFFNGTESRFTLDGTLSVILIFSLLGIGLGIVYELFFRSLLRNRGLVFGLLVTVIAAYPLAAAAIQQITFTPRIVPAIGITLLLVGFMFVPFSVLLELLLRLYHRVRNCSHRPARQAHT